MNYNTVVPAVRSPSDERPPPRTRPNLSCISCKCSIFDPSYVAALPYVAKSYRKMGGLIVEGQLYNKRDKE